MEKRIEAELNQTYWLNQYIRVLNSIYIVNDLVNKDGESRYLNHVPVGETPQDVKACAGDMLVLDKIELEHKQIISVIPGSEDTALVGSTYKNMYVNMSEDIPCYLDLSTADNERKNKLFKIIDVVADMSEDKLPYYKGVKIDKDKHLYCFVCILNKKM
jgi:hypothetical protein